MQRQVAIRITRAYKTASNVALDIIANLLPIHFYLKQMAINYYIKHEISNSLVTEYLDMQDIYLVVIQRPISFISLPHFAHRKPIIEVYQLKILVRFYLSSSIHVRGFMAGLPIYTNSS